MTNSTLKSFVDRIENLDAEQKGIGADKRTVFDEAADAGFDKKAIRRLLRDRREAAKDKGTAELAEQYKMLLSEPGATYRSVAEKTGAKKSTLHRLVPKSERGTDHDPDTGEITETAAVKQPGESSRHDRRPDGPGSALANLSCGGVESRHAVDAAVVTSGNGGARRNTPLVTPASCGDQRPTVRCGSDETDPKKAAERSNTPVASIPAGVAPGPQDPFTGSAMECAPDANATKEVDHVARTRDDQPTTLRTFESPAGGEKPATPTGGSHDAGLTPEPEVARVVPPVSDLRYDPYEETPPPFLDQRHKARARATG